MSEPVLCGEWKTVQQVKNDTAEDTEYDLASHEFKSKGPHPLDDAELLFASYMTDYYEGSAYAIWRKGEDLFEAELGHCSCNGLEGMFGGSASSCTKDYLLNRLETAEGKLARQPDRWCNAYDSGVADSDLPKLAKVIRGLP